MPGGIALIPFLGWALMQPSVRDFVDKNAGVCLVLVGLAALTLGTLFDSMSSWIETEINDACLKQDEEFKDLQEVWHIYLRTAFSLQPIGTGYVAATVMMLKFELNCSVSLVFVAGECIWLLYLRVMPLGSALICLFACFVLMAFLLYSSYQSSKVLARARKELLRGVVRR